MNLDDVLFDSQASFPDLLPILPPAGTPGVSSGRKRLLVSSTPRRRHADDFEHTDNLLMTPSGGFDIDSASDNKRRRMSSISEVMDSLRADDGSRRLSGLFTGGDGATTGPDTSPLFPSSPADDDGPHTPWTNPFTTPSTLAPALTFIPSTINRRRSIVPRGTSIKSLMDKRGKKGIEIDPLLFDKRKKELIKYSEPSLTYLRSRKTSIALFSVSSFYSDISSAIRWYVPPVVIRSLRPNTVNSISVTPVRQQMREDDYDNLVETSTVFDEPPQPQIKAPGIRTIMDHMARASGPVVMKELLQHEKKNPSACSRFQIVSDFVKSLHLLSEGVFGIKELPSSSSSNKPFIMTMNSVSEFYIQRGPRWESSIHRIQAVI
jgi:hypothetical protein